MAGELQQVKKPKKRGNQEGKGEEERKGRVGRQAGKQLCTGLRPLSCQEEVQHFQKGVLSPGAGGGVRGRVDLWRFTPGPSVKLSRKC